MKQEVYVLGMRTTQGLFYFRHVVDNGGDYEIKMTNNFALAQTLDSLDVCKAIQEKFEHEAILNIYRVELKEVSE